MEAFVPSSSLVNATSRTVSLSVAKSGQRHRPRAAKGPHIPAKQTLRDDPEDHLMFSAPGESGFGSGSTTVVWFRDDLRLHDHPALIAAHERGDTVAPLVVVPEKVSAFWTACVADLRMSLRRMGGELFIRDGTDVVKVVTDFARECGATRLHVHRGVTREDVALEQEICQRLGSLDVTCQLFWTGTLRTLTDLPFQLEQMPEDCDEFSRAVANVTIPPPLPIPENMRLVTGMNAGAIPTEHDSVCNTTNGRGGEREGLERIRDFVNGRSLASVSKDDTFRDSSLGLIGTKFGRLSPFLSMGCVSPRRVWHDVMDNMSSQCLRRFCAEFDLVLRDFTRLLTMKHGVVPA